MNRVSMDDLRYLLKELNDLTSTDHYEYCFYICNGGYGLDKIINENGGARTIIPRTTKRDLYSQMEMFIKGIEIQKEKEQSLIDYLYDLKSTAPDEICFDKMLKMLGVD